MIYGNVFSLQVKKVVADQTTQYTTINQREKVEINELRLSHIKQQSALLESLCKDAHNLQLRDLDIRQQRLVDKPASSSSHHHSLELFDVILIYIFKYTTLV